MFVFYMIFSYANTGELGNIQREQKAGRLKQYIYEAARRELVNEIIMHT